MAVLAFLYDDYDDVGISSNYRGIWDREDDALASIKGGRFGILNNLELFDLKDYSWKKYEWRPTYILRTGEYIPHPWSDKELDINRQFLKYRWGGDDSPEIEILPPSNFKVSRYGPEHDALYDAGEWVLNYNDED